MKRRPPQPKYDLTCRWCGRKIAREVTSWTIHNAAGQHDETCEMRRSYPNTEETR